MLYYAHVNMLRIHCFALMLGCCCSWVAGSVNIDYLKGQEFKVAYPDYKLLGSIQMPTDGVTIAVAADGYIAYAIDSSADLKFPYRTVLPEMFHDFTITVAFRTDSPRGGYLFSVVNPLDTVVQLGVWLSPVVRQRWNISLIYAGEQTDALQRPGGVGGGSGGPGGPDGRLATFELDYSRDWQQFSFDVHDAVVELYDDCELWRNQSAERMPRQMYFDSASTLYLAQAGKLLGGQFEVSDRLAIVERYRY